MQTMGRPLQKQEENDERQSHQKLPINILGLSLVCATPMLLGFLYGYDIGATSFVLRILLEGSSSSESDSWWSPGNLSNLQQGLFVSAVSLGALIASHCLTLHKFKSMGRRMELRVSAFLYLTGTLINVVGSGDLFRSSRELGFLALLFGRTLFGFGVGFVMHGAPAYLAEMCPPHIRGAVVSAKETVICSGIVVGYTVGNIFSTNECEWTSIYAMKFLLEIPLFVLTFYIPRSKRWLLLQGNREEAEASMRFIYQSEDRNIENVDISRAFADLVTQVQETTSLSDCQTSTSIFEVLTSLEYRPAMLASMGLILFQQVSGQPSILSYVAVLLESAGWSGNASVWTSLLMMGMSTCTVLFVDRVGRKPLLKLCCGVMLTASMVLGVCYAIILQHDDDAEAILLAPITRSLVLLSLCIYIGGYQIGFGPVTWTIVSEVFPLEVKGKAIALGVELNYLLNFAVQFGLPIVQGRLGWNMCFYLFGSVLVGAYFFVERYVPETRGLTLEEIQCKLSQGQMDHQSSQESDQEVPPMETMGLLTSR